MPRFTHSLLAAALLAAAPTAAPLPAFAADALIERQQDAGLCSDSWYLSTIRHRFGYQVRHVPDLPQVAIDQFTDIEQVRYEPEDETHPIFRQYCRAEALLSDGRSREIWYLIEGDQGFASIGNNVEFCVDGFDRWYVYNGGCRVLR